MAWCPSPLKYLLQEAHPCTAQRGASCPHILCFPRRSSGEGWGPPGDIRHGPQPPRPQGRRQCSHTENTVTQPTHPPTARAPTSHSGTSVIFPTLLHIQDCFTRRNPIYTRKLLKGKRAKAFLFVQARGNIQAPNRSQHPMLLHKHKKYNPHLVKKQLPVFTLPTQKNQEPHAVQLCTFWQCY